MFDTQNLPNIWGEGAIFAFSGMDGETNAASGFVATLTDLCGLLLHTPERRVLQLDGVGDVEWRACTGDVLAGRTDRGEILITFSAWHTIIGTLPDGAAPTLSAENGPESAETGADALVLLTQDKRFALAYAESPEEAEKRARAGLRQNAREIAKRRASYYTKLTALENAGRDRLLKKCFSVMKVNTLAPEGVIPCRWSTPDRVPHRDMWLWDSVFHSFGMNHVDPALSWEFLAAVMEAQLPDGMIAHQVRPATGWHSAITQPPLLAWGFNTWADHGDPEKLREMLPRLERYLEWNMQNRDRNDNNLLEWHIEGNPRSRSGESGMDNSPRFDRAAVLDAVEFSAFQAHDMAQIARIAEKLDLYEKAAVWDARSRAVSEAVHAHLWSKEAGFYLDRHMDGALSPVRAVSGFMPLMLDDIPTDRVDALVRALNDPTAFDAAFPVPSVAVSDPAWSTDMWRGATWINTNYMIIYGLRKHGRHAEADLLAESTIRHVQKYYERFGVTFEFFDAKDAIPPTHCDRKGRHQEPYDIRHKMDSIRDYHWTAALTFDLLLSVK